jgi:hypothetical protein
VGKQIQSIKTGIWFESLDCLKQKRNLSDSVNNIGAIAHGGPIIISFGERQTYVFQSDDFTSSLAIRIVPFDIDSPEFLANLYIEDHYFPDYLRIKTIVDLTDEYRQFIGQRIQAVKILKLPDNYFFSSTKGVKVNEMAVVFTFETGDDLIVAFRMGTQHSNGHCLLTWDLVDPEFPKSDLQCIHEHSDDK